MKEWNRWSCDECTPGGPDERFIYISLLGTIWTSPQLAFLHVVFCVPTKLPRGRRGRDRMVVGFTNTYAISAYHH